MLRTRLSSLLFLLLLLLLLSSLPCCQFCVFLSFNFATIFYANDITATKSHEFVYICVVVVFSFSACAFCCLFLLLASPPLHNSFSRSFARSQALWCVLCTHTFAHTEFVFVCVCVCSSSLRVLLYESLCHSIGHRILVFRFMHDLRMYWHTLYSAFPSACVYSIRHTKLNKCTLSTLINRNSFRSLVFAIVSFCLLFFLLVLLNTQ